MTHPEHENSQRRLAAEQTAEFYHDHFVADQVAGFLQLVGNSGQGMVADADVGGGCGFFARALQAASPWTARVLDLDPRSVEICRQHGVQAEVADALAPPQRGDESIASFNLILHHLIGRDEASTRVLQVKALRAWRGRTPRLFVHEYIYESGAFGGISADLIYAITSSRLLSRLGRSVSRLVPSLRANTFGVGVRFRSAADWTEVFAEAGWQLQSQVRGAEEPISLARRLLLIQSCRRDSFLLIPR